MLLFVVRVAQQQDTRRDRPIFSAAGGGPTVDAPPPRAGTSRAHGLLSPTALRRAKVMRERQRKQHAKPASAADHGEGSDKKKPWGRGRESVTSLRRRGVHERRKLYEKEIAQNQVRVSGSCARVWASCAVKRMSFLTPCLLFVVGPPARDSHQSEKGPARPSGVTARRQAKGRVRRGMWQQRP